jgi:hypothetical protein
MRARDRPAARRLVMVAKELVAAIQALASALLLIRGAEAVV